MASPPVYSSLWPSLTVIDHDWHHWLTKNEQPYRLIHIIYIHMSIICLYFQHTVDPCVSKGQQLPRAMPIYVSGASGRSLSSTSAPGHTGHHWNWDGNPKVALKTCSQYIHIHICRHIYNMPTLHSIMYTLHIKKITYTVNWKICIVYIYMYVYINKYVCMYIYIYVYVCICTYSETTSLPICTPSCFDMQSLRFNLGDTVYW